MTGDPRMRWFLSHLDPDHPAAKDERIPIGNWFVHKGLIYFKAGPFIQFEDARQHIAREHPELT